MSKPDDIPQDIWDAAEQPAWMAVHASSPMRVEIARAILAERERCAVIARNLPIGELHMSNETDLKALWRRAGDVQASAIAAAIRNGDSP